MELEAKVAVLQTHVEGHGAAIERLEQIVEKVRDRLPVWATWTMTIGGGIIGALVTLLTTKH